MIPDLVSFSDNAADGFRMPFNPIPDHEERGFDLMFGEDIEQLMGISWTRSIIKGERDNPLLCIQVNNVLSEGGLKKTTTIRLLRLLTQQRLLISYFYPLVHRVI